MVVRLHHNLRRLVTSVSVGFITTNFNLLCTHSFLVAHSKRPLSVLIHSKLPPSAVQPVPVSTASNPLLAATRLPAYSSRACTSSSALHQQSSSTASASASDTTAPPMSSNSPSSKEEATVKVSISDAFDGGNGSLLKSEVIDGQLTVHVTIQNDPFTQLEQTHHLQYFSFRSTLSTPSTHSLPPHSHQQKHQQKHQDGPLKVRYVLANASSTSFANAWKGYTTFASTTPSDPYSWTRQLDTSYDSTTGELSWTYDHHPSSSAVHFAYFPPYSLERHLHLISKCTMSPNAHVYSLGQTLDGRELDCITVGQGTKQCWIIHRQHPGETMAEYYAEGLLTRLLGLDSAHSVDGMTKDLLKMYTFHIVPNMCPDGSFRGHLRTNAQGQNLNREWCSSGSLQDGTFYDAPTLERSPEVYHVLHKMDETGVDIFLDVHGDEELPFNFLAGGEGCPNWSHRLQSLHGAFLAKYSRTNSDMQILQGYEPEEPKQGRLNVCSNQILSRYDCLAVTLEMPFKDCKSNPDPERGWNPARAKMLGASVLAPLLYVGPYLRVDGAFWEDAFGSEDLYVKPTSKYEP